MSATTGTTGSTGHTDTDPDTGRPVEMLRIATAGSVDDGKSTLIGRLLYDSKSVFEDQLASVTDMSLRRGGTEADLSLLTDGLRAEREQGITIDVAYRYFATPRRKFIVADTPGHLQYTRNMVTGASTADLAMVLIDARKGVLEQSRRHAFLAGLLRIPHLVLCVNKMDLVGYDQDVFERIRAEFADFAARLDIGDVTFIPMSALRGDNVVTRTDAMPWYEGPSLLHHLENVHFASDRNLVDVRFPVQYVLRGEDFRGYAGTVAGGIMRAGDDVVVLPSGRTTTIASVRTADGPVEEAFAPMAVTLTLADELDVSRGDMVCRPDNRPHTGSDVEAMICWMADAGDLRPGATYALKHTTRTTRVEVAELRYRLDVNTLHRDPDATALGLNDIGRVRLRTTTPLFHDPYRRNRATGGFILVDEATNATAGAGIILDPRG